MSAPSHPIFASLMLTRPKEHRGLLWYRLYTMKELCLEFRLGNYESQVSCMTQLEDGRLATGSSDGTVRIWNGKHPLCTLQGHTDTVTRIAQRITDGLLISESADSTVCVWPMAGGDPDVFTGVITPFTDGSQTTRSWNRTEDRRRLFRRALLPKTAS